MSFEYIKNKFPTDDGFCMPAEFSKHSATIMIWPERPGSWCYEAKFAEKVFAEIIGKIAEFEKVFVLASNKKFAHAKACLEGVKNAEVLNINSDDAWARDVAPTFVRKGNVSEEHEIRAVNWEFNAWGGEVDGLYASWEKDNAFAKYFAEIYGYPVYDAAPFVLEGGSIHSDGEGTVMVTESCLLSAGRNPKLSKEEIEQRLKQYLGAKKVLWLPRGIYQDETNEHVDNVCAFLRPGEVVLAWTDNREDPQYALSAESLAYLEQETDAKGRKLVIHKLPIPDIPACITSEELAGYTFVIENEKVAETTEEFYSVLRAYAGSFADVEGYEGEDKPLVKMFKDGSDVLVYLNSSAAGLKAAEPFMAEQGYSSLVVVKNAEDCRFAENCIEATMKDNGLIRYPLMTGFVEGGDDDGFAYILKA